MLIPQVPAPFPLRWGFSTKLDRGDLTDLLPVRISQVHGCGVVEADETIAAVVEADGVWTQQPGLCIGVRVADCVPILLAGLAGLANDRPWVASLHAGWRGATAGILRRGVEVFRERGGDPASLAWALGPAIQRCHFEVGWEVIASARLDPAWDEELLIPFPGAHPHLDLPGFLRAQAFDLGLDPGLDGSIPLCTACQRELLWSYRSGDTHARQWGWVEISV